MLDNTDIQNILTRFDLTFESVTAVHDTSHGPNDERFSYILDEVTAGEYFASAAEFSVWHRQYYYDKS